MSTVRQETQINIIVAKEESKKKEQPLKKKSRKRFIDLCEEKKRVEAREMSVCVKYRNPTCEEEKHGLRVHKIL